MAPSPFLSTLVALLAASGVPVIAAPTSDIGIGDKPNHGPIVYQNGFQILNPNVTNPVTGAYIAVYKTTASDSAVTSHQAQIASSIARRNLERRQLQARDGEPSKPDTSVRTIQVSEFRALTIQDADQLTLAEVYASPEIAYIEQDSVVHAYESATESDAPSGLSRISHAVPDPSSGYIYDNSAGYGITAYVCDTGIQLNHTDFQGRAIWGTNVVDSMTTDDNGHGTHVAGTLGGRTYGVAKNIELVAVRVLGTQATTTFSNVLAAFDWVVANATARKLAGRAVVNVSLGGGKTQAINDAVTGIVNAGIVFVTAAGNEAADAADESPASAPDAITVGAIDQRTDIRDPNSNYGPFVTVFAPGVDVLSTFIGPTTMGTETISGTSMAAPHVAGLAGYLMKFEGIRDPKAVKQRIVELAGLTGAHATDNGPNTTSLIANNGNL